MTLTEAQRKEFDDFYLQQVSCPKCSSNDCIRYIVGRPSKKTFYVCLLVFET